MSHSDKLERHKRLMTTMAARNGADVAIAEQVGLLTPEEVQHATVACAGCSDVASCEQQLAAGEGGLPEFCRNDGMIRRLAQEMADFGLSDS